MNDKNTLNLARVFAESVESRPSAYDEQVRAAAYLILSLPDDLEDLLPAPPAPRTLSDMAPEERAGCQWMQAKDDVGNHVIITELDEEAQEGRVLYENGGQCEWPYEILVPLPDLPRMVWPETTEKEHGEAPCLLDKDGDHWVKVGGQWKMVDPDFGYDELPERYGPYRPYFQEEH